MQILADRIEFCWIHLRGIGSLENSLWGYDGQSIRVWLNALAIEAPSAAPEDESSPMSVKESVSIPLDFYPLCELESLTCLCSERFADPVLAVLMDKGIIIGVEHEAATRMNLPFVMFRHVTSVSVIQRVVHAALNCLADPPFPSPHPSIQPRKRSITRRSVVCFALSASSFLRTRSGDPSA